MKMLARVVLVLAGLASHAACSGDGDPTPQCGPKTACGFACVDLVDDPNNCGACGTACDAKAGEVCDAGKCNLACSGGTKKCNGVCVDTKADRANCGDCGKTCDAGLVCDGSGLCSFSCVKGQLVCGGKCVDPLTDNAFCGAAGDCVGTSAGKKCDPGNVCSDGKCGLSCAKDQVKCNGKCVDPLTDNAFCGANGDCAATNAGKACEAGNVCSNGKCALTCSKDQLNCGGKCVDPKTTNAYCGATADCKGANDGEVCPSGSVCSAGKCSVTCVAGQVVCNGKCIDPLTDNAFCGASGDCSGMNAGAKCPTGEICNGSGKCAASCLATQLLCNGKCIDPNTDNAFCGAKLDCAAANAGKACGAGFVCSKGSCALSCQAGLVDCNGKCIDPKTDNAFCGATGDCHGTSAGSACSAGHVCSNGSCALSCQSGLVDCNGKCIDPKADKTYCGATTDCQGANAGMVCGSGFACINGSCTASCQAGLVNCSNKCVDPQSNPDFCGAKLDCLGANKGTTCGAGKACVSGSCKGVVVTSCSDILASGMSTGDGIYTIAPSGGPFSVYCDMTKDGGGWTLIARFSNADAKNWMIDNGDWWYDQTNEQGSPTSRSTNADALSKAFFRVSGDRLKISRSDNVDDTGLLVTNAGCLGSKTFREFLTGFGNFRVATWRPGGNLNGVAKTCAGSVANNFATTLGFGQAQCSDPLGYGAPGALSFWTAFQTGDGAVMTIGGIGGTDSTGCRRADHGIGITEAGNPKFADGGEGEADFGHGMLVQGPVPGDPGYALNLFIK